LDAIGSFLSAMFSAIMSFIGGAGDGIKNMFSGLMNMFGGNNAAQATTPPATTPQNPLQNAINTGGEVVKAAQTQANNAINTVKSAVGMSANVNVTMQSAPASGKFTNDNNKAYWCSVDETGKPVAGNNIDKLGDSASTTKLLAVFLVCEDPKLKGFTDKPRIKKAIENMAHDSSNKEADVLLREAAKARGMTEAALVKEYNEKLKSMGFQKTEIANFSGLPTPDGHIFIRGDDPNKPYRNVSTAHEMATFTQMFMAKHKDIAGIFYKDENTTGMKDVEASWAVKTGTAFGVLRGGSEGGRAGAKKAAVASSKLDANSNGLSDGAIGVIESTVGEWKPTINMALASITPAGNVQDATSFPPSSTPSQPNKVVGTQKAAKG
jgi:hypothetical protein